MIKSPIAIMQGRLSPPRPDRLQCFPWRTWEREFEHAAALGVFYESGNSAARGYDTAADILSLAPLGQGAARFDRFFAALRPLGYGGVFTLETASGADFLGDARRHVQFVKERWQ